MSALTITNSSITGNTASNGPGGGILAAGTVNSITGCTFSGNSATGDGGALAISSNASLLDCTLSGNTAGQDGGAIAIFDPFATLYATNSTLAGNKATGDAGAIYNASSLVFLTNSTVSGNSAGTSGGIDTTVDSINGPPFFSVGQTTLNNTIVAGNTVGSTPSDLSGSPVQSASSHNLIGDSSTAGGLTNGVNGNIVGKNPLLSALGNYGGATQTMALLPGSPAIDAGNNALAIDPSNSNAALTTDQRGQGYARLVNSIVDIGAYESEGFTIAATSGTPQSTDVNTPFANPLKVTVTAYDPLLTNLAGGIVTFRAPTTGASATFSSLTATLAADGTASVTATANSTVGGPYNVTTSASGITAPASFALTNKSAVITPVFSNLSGPTIIYYSLFTVLSGKLSSGALIPPGSVTITLNGTRQTVSIKSGGSFSAIFFTGFLKAGTYTVQYAYAGSGNFAPVTTSSTLKVTYKIDLGFDNDHSYKAGSTIPVEFEVADAFGQDVNNTATSATATAIALASSPNIILPVPAGSSAGGKFSPDRDYDDYSLNLKTTGLNPGTYLLYFNISGDPITHSLTFVIK